MSTVSIRVDKELYDMAVKAAQSEYRSAPQQISFWAKIGQNALANPDLPIDFIKDTLIAKEQPSEPFELDSKRDQCD